MATKLKGQPIAQYEDFKIYVTRKKPKRAGKDRVWFSIRQDGQEKWRIAASLSYVNSIDVRFEK